MEIINLFPTTIGSFKLNRNITEEENLFLRSQEQKPNEGNTTSANRLILNSSEIVGIKEFIKNGIDEYFKIIQCPEKEVELNITQSWLNYSEPGQWHHKHSHSNSFLSGCFYVNADKDLDKIYFYKEQYKQIKIPSKEFNLSNSDSWWLPVGTGDLIIFPSSLTHMVQNVEAKETRISIAFNTFPVGYIGNDDSLTGLHL
jgi:uncharacterized protein (TIGR02466 family)